MTCNEAPRASQSLCPAPYRFILPNQSFKVGKLFPRKYLRAAGTFREVNSHTYGWAGVGRRPSPNRSLPVTRAALTSAAAKANSVRIKVQWNADVLFALGVERTPRGLPWTRPQFFIYAHQRISALTGHRHGLKKWPTQNLSSRQPAWATTQAGQLFGRGWVPLRRRIYAGRSLCFRLSF